MQPQLTHLFDSHAHLDDPRFDEDRHEVIASLPENGVEGMVNIGCDLQSSRQSVALAEVYPYVWATVGIHPHEAKTITPEALEELRELARHEKVVAIGEVGLDYYYDHSPREIQKLAFQMQIRLAQEVDLPLVIHSREATKDVTDLLFSMAPDHKVLLHCYSGSVEQAKLYVDQGYYISLAGPVTYGNAKVPKEVAKAVPLDRLLIETDSPYLTPVPRRGKRNDPRNVAFTCGEIARLRGMDPQELAKITAENAKHFYGIQ